MISTSPFANIFLLTKPFTNKEHKQTPLPKQKGPIKLIKPSYTSTAETHHNIGSAPFLLPAC